MILQLGLQILLPAFLLVSLWRGKLSSRTEWLLKSWRSARLFCSCSSRHAGTLRVTTSAFSSPILLVPAAYMSYRRQAGYRWSAGRPSHPQ